MLFHIAHDGGLQDVVQPFHEATACRVVGVILQSSIPQSFARLWNSCDLNWRPCSVTMVCERPKRDIQSESRERDTVSAVMSGIGKASGQHVKQSTAVRQY